MFYLLFLALAVFAAFIYFSWKRVLAMAVVWVAQQRRVQLTIDEFTGTSASGLKIRLNKGPVGEASVRHIQLAWGDGEPSTGILNILVSKGPRLRVLLTGVQLILAPPKVGASPTAGNANPLRLSSDGPSLVAKETSGAAFALLQFLGAEINDLEVKDEDSNIVFSAQNAVVKPASQQQQLSFTDISILPSPATGEDVLRLQYASLRHYGPFPTLGRDQIQLQDLTLEFGDARVCVLPDTSHQIMALLGRFARSKKKENTMDTIDLHSKSSLQWTILPRRMSVTWASAAVDCTLTTRKELQDRPVSAFASFRSLEGVWTGASASVITPLQRTFSMSLSWQKFGFGIGGDRLSPRGSTILELQCSATQLGAVVTPLVDPANIDSGGFDVDASAHVNAMHTKIQYRNLPDVVTWLEIIAASKRDNDKDDDTSAKRRTRLTIVKQWTVSAALGEGSSMQFFNDTMDCVWSSSIHSANIVLNRSQSYKGIGLDFSACDISMRTPAGPVQLEKALATRAVQLRFSPSKNDANAPSSAEISASEVLVLLRASAVSMVADVLGTLHKVVSLKDNGRMKRRRGQVRDGLGFCLSFELTEALLVAPTTVTIPGEHSSTGKLQLLHSTLGLVLSKTTCTGSMRGRTGALVTDGFDVLYCEGLGAQRFPESIESFRRLEKCTVVSLRDVRISQELLPKHSGNMSDCEALIERRRRVRLEKITALGDADAIGCAIQAADDILAAYKLLATSSAVIRNTRSTGAVPAEEGGLDAVVVDNTAAGTSGGELEAMDILQVTDYGDGDAPNDDHNPSYHRKDRSMQNAPSTPLYVDIVCARASLPLSADLEIAFEVDAAHAELSGGHGIRLIRSLTAAVKMKGKPFIRWDEVSLSLHTIDERVQSSQGKVPLPLQPLFPYERPKPGKSGSTPPGISTRHTSTDPEWSIRTSPGSSPTAAKQEQHHQMIFDTPSPSLSHSATPEPRSDSRAETSLPSGLLPYKRARLSPWLRSRGFEDSVMDESSSSSSADRVGSNHYLGTGPSTAADVYIRGLDISVPYDREPGPTLRYAGMYFKALKSAFRQGLIVLRKRSQREPGGVEVKEQHTADTALPKKNIKGGRSERDHKLFPMQVNLRVDGVVFCFEHHPMESWFAVHGPMLQRAALQSYLWSEVSATVAQADSMTSPLHAGIVESALVGPPDAGHGPAVSLDDKSVQTPSRPGKSEGSSTDGKDQAWEGLMRVLAAQYRAEVSKAAAMSTSKAEKTASRGARKTLMPCCDLFVVTAESLQALVVVCEGTGHAHDAALHHVKRVDPPSSGVEFAAARLIHTDTVLHNVSVRLASASQPFVAVDRLTLSGPMGIARQRTAPPVMTTRTLAVGSQRAVPIQVNMRGCRPPFKLYTDCIVEGRRAAVCFSPGYEPFLAMMGMAGKRLAPSDPDKTAPRPPPVPWWDDVRYLWRGHAGLKISNALRVVLAAHQRPMVDDLSERMVIRASQVHGELQKGEMFLDCKDFSCTLFQAGDVTQGSAVLVALPFIEAPSAKFRVQVTWKLPNGRDPANHHLFPPRVTEGSIQDPVILAHEYKAEGMDLSLEVRLGGGKDASALGFLGDHQIAFLKDFGRSFKTPLHVKACAKRGTYFARKPRGQPPKKGLPRLLQLLRLSVGVEPLEMVHFTIDPTDPSGALRFSATSASFAGSWMLNQPVPSFLRLPPHVREKPSHAHPNTRTIAQDFFLRFCDINMHFDPARNDFPHLGDLGKLDSFGRADPTPVQTLQVLDGARDSDATREEISLSDGEDQASYNSDAEIASSPHGRQRKRGISLLLRTLIDRQRTESHDTTMLQVAGVSVARELPGAGDDGPGGGNSDPGDGGDDPVTCALEQGDSRHRPLRVVVKDCRFIVNLGTRDAVWGAVSHFVSAFSRKPALGRVMGATGATGQHMNASRAMSPLGGILTSPSAGVAARRDAAAEVQRRVTQGPVQRSPSTANDSLSGPESNELLALLLKQKHDESQSGAPADSSMHTAGQGDLDDDDTHAEDADVEMPMTTPVDDIHSRLRYEVEVINLQVVVLTGSGRDALEGGGGGVGRLLLAAEKGHLRGLTLEDGPAPVQITTLSLEAVQAYVSLTDVDPHVSTSWLDVNPGRRFSAPLDRGPSALRRVFNPIRIDMRHSKVRPSALTTYRQGPGLASLRSPSPTGPGPSGVGARSEELVLQIPEIVAAMEGREFEVILDAVSLMLMPGPRVRTLLSEARLLVESESDDVEDARQLFVLVKQQLTALHAEALIVRQCIGGHVVRRNGGEVSRGAEVYALALPAPTPGSMRGSSQGGTEDDHIGIGLAGQGGDPPPANANTTGSADLLPVLTAMREHLAGEALAVVAATSSSGKGSSVHPPARQQRRKSNSPRAERLRLLLRWVEEQEAGALATYERTKAMLLSFKGASSSKMVNLSASRVLLQVDRVVWQLCTPERTPFVQASLRGLTFDRHRNRDQSGSAKFIIHRIEIIDATGELPEGPATPHGVILTVWNPDASYEREPVLRVIATMGIPTATHVVFQHLDASLHPLSLHLTEAIAVSCWEYFFPKEDSRSRQEAFALSVGGGTAGSASNVGVGRRRGATEHAPATPQYLSGGPGSPDGMSPQARPSSEHSSSSLHHRTQHQSLPHRPAPRGEGSFGQGEIRRESLGMDTGTSTTTTASTFMPQLSVPATSGSVARELKSAKAQPRKRFVYVKLNRAHMRITYQGYPIGIRDRILVINSYTCENLEGRWRDLLANVKQKAILSAVWSGLGLQGRKIRELMEGAAPTGVPAVLPPGDEPRGAKAFLAKMGLAPGSKARREAANAAMELSEEDLKALQKKRALFGDQMMRTMARTPLGATPSSGDHRAQTPPSLSPRMPIVSLGGVAGPSSSHSLPPALLEVHSPAPHSVDGSASEGPSSSGRDGKDGDDLLSPLRAGLSGASFWRKGKKSKPGGGS